MYKYESNNVKRSSTKRRFFNDIIMSNNKKSLLMIVAYIYEKSEELPVEYRKWFEIPISSHYKTHVATIQNLIKVTKILFKSHK